MVNHLTNLIVIIFVAWMLVFLGSTFIFVFIVPITPFYEGFFGTVLTAIVKVVISAILVILWLYILIWLTKRQAKKDLYKDSKNTI